MSAVEQDVPTSTETAKPLTPDAAALLAKIDAGGRAPAFLTKGLKKIANENGVAYIEGTTPEQIIEALRKGAAVQTATEDAVRESVKKTESKQAAPEGGPAGMRVHRPAPAQDDVAEDTAKDDSKKAESVQAAVEDAVQEETKDKPAAAENAPNTANADCLAAIAKVYGVKKLEMTEYLGDFTQVKTGLEKYALPQAETAVVVKSSDNEFVITKDLIQAQIELISPKAAFEMALLAFNNPEIRKQGVDLQGNLRDRYLLQLAADTVGIKITNRVEDADIPADLKGAFAETAAQWEAFMNGLQNPDAAPAPASKKAEGSSKDGGQKQTPETETPAAAPREKQEPTLGDLKTLAPDLAGGRVEPTVDFDSAATDVPAPTLAEALDTTSPKVVETARKLSSQTSAPSPKP